MALCAGLAGNTADKTKYEKLASALRSKLEPAFWNEQKQAMVHNRVQGKQSESVTRYANMFSVFFNYLNADKQQTIKHTVLQNDSILKSPLLICVSMNWKHCAPWANKNR